MPSGGPPITLRTSGLVGTIVELISYEGASIDPAPRAEHLGYRMIALEVDDMQKTADHLRTKGVGLGPTGSQDLLKGGLRISTVLIFSPPGLGDPGPDGQ
jgi:hypothetical protein